MGTSALAALAVQLGMLGSLVMLVVVVLAEAMLLCTVFRLRVGYMPSCLHAIGVVLLSVATAAAVSIAAQWLLPDSPHDALGLVAALLIGAGWVDYQLLALDGLRIGYAKALQVQVIFLGISLLLWMAFAAMGTASHAIVH